MTQAERSIRRRLLRATIRRIRIMREMGQNTFTLTKFLRQQFKLRHRPAV